MIETKYRSGHGLITFRNGQGIFVGEKRCWNGATAQAKRGAKKVSKLVRDECGLREGVWPVVVFVGNWRVADEWAMTTHECLLPNR